jgi:hypothetical protein
MQLLKVKRMSDASTYHYEHEVISKRITYFPLPPVECSRRNCHPLALSLRRVADSTEANCGDGETSKNRK